MLVLGNSFEVRSHHVSQLSRHQKRILVLEPLLHVFLAYGGELLLLGLDYLSLVFELVLCLGERALRRNVHGVEHLPELVFPVFGFTPSLLLADDLQFRFVRYAVALLFVIPLARTLELSDQLFELVVVL